MSVSIGDVIEESLRHFATAAGAILVAVAFPAAVLSQVASRSFGQWLFEYIVELEFMQEFFRESELSREEFLAQLPEHPFALDIGPVEIAALWLGAAIVFTVLSVVAVRVFVEDRPLSLRREHVGSLAIPTLNVFVANVLILLLVTVGMVLLVLPGLGVIVVLLSILFVWPAVVAVENENFVSAMFESASLTKGERFPVLGAALVVVAIAYGISVATGFVGGAVGVVSPVVADLIRAAGTAGQVVFSMAGVARVYVALQDEDEPEPDDAGAREPPAGRVTQH